MPTKIDSPAQWRQILSSHAVVIADCTNPPISPSPTITTTILTPPPPVYADWCGPCKMIAPTFDSLATKYAKPNKIAFVKVDVDAQGEVAQQYSVRAMPTFLVLRNGSVIDTIQGANPPALTAAVDKAVKLAGVGGAGGGATFSGAGNRLGGVGVGRPVGGGGGRSGIVGGVRWDLKGFVEAVLMFFGLYFWTLFSVGCLRRLFSCGGC